MGNDATIESRIGATQQKPWRARSDRSVAIGQLARSFECPALRPGWGDGERAAQLYFRPLETYAARLGTLLDEIVELGFENIDLWMGHLNPDWATLEHVVLAREILARRGLQVMSLAGYFGDTLDQFEAACQLALALRVLLLAGNSRCLIDHRADTLALLRKYSLVLGIENETATAEVVSNLVGDQDADVLGAIIDTGSFDENGGDSVAAIERLGSRIRQVHLRNCLSRTNSEAARFDAGLVPMPAVIRALRDVNYAGGISIEHVAYGFDPREDCRCNLEWLREQL